MLGRMLIRAVFSTIATLVVCCCALEASPPRPTSLQAEYQERELSMFMHFSMCTYAGCEQDTACSTNPPRLFNPVGLDTDQWVGVAKVLTHSLTHSLTH